MKGYKVFEADFTCRSHQFSENSEHKLEGAPRLCSHGFHFCQKPNDCFNYYSFNPENIVCEVEAIGDIDSGNSDDKSCTNHIRIGRRLEWHEVLSIVNQGKNNTGRANTGDRNTGDRNTGDRNTGDRNTGDLNTGDLNTGDWNTGNWNTGDLNTGNWNTGNWNTGNLNTGNWNTGDRNTGDLNTGNWNTGNWNTASHSAGILCTEASELLIFDQPSGITMSDWMAREEYYLMRQITLTKWVSWSSMTAEEKEEYPRAETQEGYLKQHEWKAAHATWWTELTDRQRSLFTSLPNFDPEKFKAITGIDTTSNE